MSAPIATESGTIIQLPIRALIVDANIRRTVDQSDVDRYAKSIAQVGVLEPVDAYQDADGGWHLQDGQLRYLASLKAGLESIPVLVQDPALAEAVKVQRQLIKNELRTEISDNDRAGAYVTLFDIGITADDIVELVGADAEKVSKAIKVRSSKTTTEAFDAGTLTLDQAAQLADFENHPTLLLELLTVAVENPSNFNWKVRNAHLALEDAAAKQKILDKFVKAGTPILLEPVVGAVPLKDVFTDQELTTPVSIVKAKGHGLVGSPVQGDREWIPRLGEYRTKWEAKYFVVDPIDNGFYIDTTKAEKPEPSDEEKAERRRVRDNNKAWPIATELRTEWITTNLLNRNTMPSDAEKFMALSMAGGFPADSYGTGRSLAKRWLDIAESRTTAGWAQELALEIEKKPGNARRIAIAIACAEAEGALRDKGAWRTSSTGTEQQKLTRYLEFLASWGHNLSDVEGDVIIHAKAGN